MTLLLLAVMLTASGCWKTTSQSSPAIFAPSVITLEADRSVTVKEGTLTPPEDVVFYRFDYVQELLLKIQELQETSQPRI